MKIATISLFLALGVFLNSIELSSQVPPERRSRNRGGPSERSRSLNRSPPPPYSIVMIPTTTELHYMQGGVFLPFGPESDRQNRPRGVARNSILFGYNSNGKIKPLLDEERRMVTMNLLTRQITRIRDLDDAYELGVFSRIPGHPGSQNRSPSRSPSPTK